MPDIDKQIMIVERMAKREELISQLYKDYAGRFREEKGFWERLAKDEVGHAALIRTISMNMMDGTLYFEEDRFRQESIEYAMDYIQEMVAGGLSEGTTLAKALKVAFDIENCLIEKGSFEAFANDPPRLKSVLESLVISNKRHRDRVKALMDSLKR